jgi:anti-sigma B factor antagonist
MQTTLNTRNSEETSIVDASGKLVLGKGTNQIRQEVLALLADGRKQILVNLNQVTFMDSSAVGELVAAHTLAASLGGQMKLVSSKRVQDILSIAKLHLVFEVFEDEREALRSFNSTRALAV